MKKRYVITASCAVIVALLAGCAQVQAILGGGVAQVIEKFSPTDEANTLLRMALQSSYPNAEGVKEAIAAGADLNELGATLPAPLIYCGKYVLAENMVHNISGVEIAELLLQGGADPNHTNSVGTTLLMECAGASNGQFGSGYEALLHLLLDYEADVQLTDMRGYTALDYAVSYATSETVRTLLDHGATVSDQTIQLALYTEESIKIRSLLEKYLEAGGAPQINPILISAAQGDSEAVIAKLQAELPENILDPLVNLVVSYCNADAVKSLQAAYPALDLNSDSHKASAYIAGNFDAIKLFSELGYIFNLDGLKAALYYNQSEMAQYFLQCGALDGYVPPNNTDGFPWEVFDNLLQYPAKFGDIELLDSLIALGYPLNEASMFTAINAAIAGDQLETVKYFLNKGYNPNFQYDDNGTIFDTACVKGSIEIIQYLLNQGTELEGHPEYLVSASGNVDATRCLLEHGAKPNGIGKLRESESALIAAIRYGNYAVIQALLEHGADINMVIGDATYATTAIHEAARAPSTRILQCMIDQGADVNVLNSRGDTPLDVAINTGNKANEKILRATEAVESHKDSAGS